MDRNRKSRLGHKIGDALLLLLLAFLTYYVVALIIDGFDQNEWRVFLFLPLVLLLFVIGFVMRLRKTV